jgi:hypothetical protein
MQRNLPVINRSSQYIENPARLLSQSFPLRIAAFIILHLFLALIIRQNAALATGHALITFGAAFYFLVKDKEPDRLILAAAYLVGAEVIWRMTDAAIFWESGKYAITLLFILALLKHQQLFQTVKWPVIFFILLLPSVALLPTFDREIIAFNLSGPLSLAVATMYFSTITLNQTQIKRLLLALYIPIVMVAFLATYSTFTAGEISFDRSSLAVTSGGYGPNQVSSILGLGALTGLLYVFIERRYRLLRLFLIIGSLWMLAQAALTFSRGGMLTMVATLLFAALFILRDSRSRVTFIGGAVLLILLWSYLVFPTLNNFTGGALATRIRDLDLTGRDKIIQADLLAFRENIFAGVGIGQSPEYHALLFRRSAAHTEFTRWLAEHGLFGLLALALFSMVVLRRLLIKQPPLTKALILSFTLWSLLFMSHAAMRLAAPSFVFGLAAAVFMLNDSVPKLVSNATR